MVRSYGDLKEIGVVLPFQSQTFGVVELGSDLTEIHLDEQRLNDEDEAWAQAAIALSDGLGGEPTSYEDYRRARLARGN